MCVCVCVCRCVCVCVQVCVCVCVCVFKYKCEISFHDGYTLLIPTTLSLNDFDNILRSQWLQTVVVKIRHFMIY